MQRLLSASVQPIWTSIRATRYSVGQALAQYPAPFVQATMMVASELLENAIKYGDEVPKAPSILFTLGRVDDCIRIETVNGCADRAATRDLLDRVRSIREADDKGALYLARLEQLLVTPNESAKLGLYRIAYEGEYELDCKYEDEVVTIVATRRIP